ncbi:MAG: hypothetical protein M1819_006989 [Sarea resinae]|nr:MAG: hypothetical protein M1819_006989 [Sarea resinae]
MSSVASTMGESVDSKDFSRTGSIVASDINTRVEGRTLMSFGSTATKVERSNIDALASTTSHKTFKASTAGGDVNTEDFVTTGSTMAPSINIKDTKASERDLSDTTSTAASETNTNGKGLATRGFPCTFADCRAIFDSAAQLKRHKSYTPSHDYCKLCDLDFEDDLGFLKHKVESTKHIVCPICSEDFKSKAGRDGHFRQFHAAEQNIKCVGCGSIFIRAGGLMQHIEKDLCGTVTRKNFEKHRATKELVNAFLNNPEGRRGSSILSGAASTIASIDNGGGVSLKDLESILDEQDGGSTKGSLIAPLSQKSKVKQDGTWPQLGEGSEVDDSEVDLLTGADSRSVASVSTRWGGGGGSASSKLFPGAPKTPVTPEEATRLEELAAANTVNGFNTHVWHPGSKDFRAEAFKNHITDKYHCPYPRCVKTYTTSFPFEAHMRSHLGDTAKLRCPCCLRLFDTATALIQHCETATSRCRINQSDKYGVAIDQFSGGLLEAKGRHEDGTIKYKGAERKDDGGPGGEVNW